MAGPRPHPLPFAADQRRDRALLRLAQVRAPVSAGGANGAELGDECEAYGRLYNEIRLYESLALYPPLDTYLATPLSFEAERDSVASTRAAAPAPAPGEDVVEAPTPGTGDTTDVDGVAPRRSCGPVCEPEPGSDHGRVGDQPISGKSVQDP